MSSSLYHEKYTEYFNLIRKDIIDLVPHKNNKIFELGCGSGKTLMELKKEGKSEYIAGMDIVDLGQDKRLDKFLLCDIETIERLPFPENYFDVIICADVLEHLIDPYKAVAKLVKYLKKEGLFITSIPNIREIRTIYNIVFKGDFKYSNAGILDNTHLRFFCKKNAIKLLVESGLDIDKITYKLSPKRAFLNNITLGLLEEFFVMQYLIVGIKR